MHICHVVSGLLGGPEVLIAQLANAQHRAGHRLTIVYSSLRDDVAKSRHLFPDNAIFLPWRVGRDISLRSDWSAYHELRDILAGPHPTLFIFTVRRLGRMVGSYAACWDFPELLAARVAVRTGRHWCSRPQHVLFP